MGYIKLNERNTEGSESKLYYIKKKAKTNNQDLLKTFGELVRDAQQHITKSTTKVSVTMTSKGRHCEWGIV